MRKGAIREGGGHGQEYIETDICALCADVVRGRLCTTRVVHVSIKNEKDSTALCYISHSYAPCSVIVKISDF